MHCQVKARYPTLTMARDRARKARQLHGDALAPYHCAECGGYHYGHYRRPSINPAQRVRAVREWEALGDDD